MVESISQFSDPEGYTDIFSLVAIDHGLPISKFVHEQLPSYTPIVLPVMIHLYGGVLPVLTVMLVVQDNFPSRCSYPDSPSYSIISGSLAQFTTAHLLETNYINDRGLATLGE